jgi:Fibronectin type III domain
MRHLSLITLVWFVAVEFSQGASVPTAPSGLLGKALSSSQIRLTWYDNSNNETGFKVERSVAGAPFTEIVRLGANITSFTDTGLTSSTSYYYRVRTYNAYGNSTFSNTALVKTTMPTPLSIPSNQTVLPGSMTLNDTNPSFSYSGAWYRGSQGAYDYLADEHYSSATGATAMLTFKGTQAQLYSTGAFDLGDAEILLDGRSVGYVDCYTPGRTASRIIYTSPVLPYGTHTLVTRVMRIKNPRSSYYYVVVDRANVVVGTPNPTPTSTPTRTRPPTTPTPQPSPSSRPAAAMAVLVTLQWDPPVNATNVVSYNISWGKEIVDPLTGRRTAEMTNKMNILAPTTRVTITLPDLAERYFVVTAVGIDGHESVPSNRVGYPSSIP